MKTLLLFLASACALAAQKVVGGPFVINATPRAATVVWVVQTGEVTLQVPGAAPKTSPTLRVEHTSLAGLKSGTEYKYSVLGDNPDGQGSFKTPSIDASPYKFAVYGDTRTRNDVHRNVIGALLKDGTPDFVMHTGDMVADGHDTSLWPVFFDIEREVLRHTVFFPSLGNHEKNTPYFYELFRQITPYYAFNWGSGRYIVLNTDIDNAGLDETARQKFWAEQTAWLEGELAGHQSSTFRFVFGHHPPYTAVARRQGDNEQVTALVPMFEKYKVTAAFFGHDHNYQHYLKNGIHYFITGGGGAPLYDVDKPPVDLTQKVESIENYVKVSVDGKIARLQAMTIDGRKLDEVELLGTEDPGAGKPGGKISTKPASKNEEK